MTDHETTASIIDPVDGTPTAIRIWFTPDLPYEECRIVGVFRLDDDSEIDFTSLAIAEQDKINKACEHDYFKSNTR